LRTNEFMGVVGLKDSKYRSVERWNGVRWGTFKDGWPNIFIDDVQSIAGRDGKNGGT